MRTLNLIVIFILEIFSLVAMAEPQQIRISQQLLVVTAKDVNATQATLQRLSRPNINQTWQAIGTPINVVIGKNGMALRKKEGDGRSPMGIFSINSAFGFATKPDFKLKLSYLPIINSTVCVDDQKSKYYNQIIDGNQVEKNSWSSGEKMREEVPSYTWGAVISYNSPKPVLGAGSCIFMHVWKTPDHGTAGCVAMSEDNVKQVLAWLDPAKKPQVLILPVNEYKKIQQKWHLLD